MIARPRSVLGGLALTAALALAACGSGTATPAATATPAPTAAGASAALPSTPAVSLPSSSAGGAGGGADAASILTQDVAASIIGGTLTKIPVPAVGGMSIVAYTNDSGGSVTALTEPVPAGAGTALMQAAIAAAGAQGNLQTLSGLGDGAGKVVDANEATVVFIKGSTLAVISASSSASGTELESKIEQVAHQIADRL